MKTYNRFILEKIYTDKKDSDINDNIIDLCEYIYNYLKDNQLNHHIFSVKELSKSFPFMSDWVIDSFKVKYGRIYSDYAGYLKGSNMVIVSLNRLTIGDLIHEITHVFQSAKDITMLKTGYESEKIILQIKGMIIKNSFNMHMIRLLMYMTDKMEIEAFLNSFKFKDRESQISMVVMIFLLKYFDMKYFIKGEDELNKIISLWKHYYGTSIPFFDKLSYIFNSSKIPKITDEDAEKFITFINEKLQDTGNYYLIKLTNQYSNSEEELDYFANILSDSKKILLQDDKLISKLITFDSAKILRLSPTLRYDIKNDTIEKK